MIRKDNTMINKSGEYVSTFINPEEPDENIVFIDENSEYAELFSNNDINDMISIIKNSN